LNKLKKYDDKGIIEKGIKEKVNISIGVFII